MTPFDGNILHTGTSYPLTNVTSPTSYWAESFYDDGASGCAAPTRKQISISVTQTPSPATGSDKQRCGTGSVTLSASGPAGSSIRWYSVPSGGISLETGNTYVTPPLSIGTTTYYAETYIGNCKAVSRTPIDAIVYPDLNGGTINGASTICYNSDPGNLASVSTASGCSGGYVYQWQYHETSGTATSGWVNIPNTNSSSHNPSTDLTSDRWYRRQVQSNGIFEYSNVVKITVRPGLNPGSISGGETICYGGNPSSITSSGLASGGDSNYSYFWQWSTTGSTNWNSISGAQLESYDPPGNLTLDRWYRRGVSSCGETKYTSPIQVAVLSELAAPTVNANIVPVCPGDDVSVNATPGSGGNIVRWYTDQVGGTHEQQGTLYLSNVTGNVTYYASTYNTTTLCESSQRTTVAIGLIDLQTFYLDADGDGFAVSTTQSCSSPGAGYTTDVLPLGDCDDTNVQINPDTFWKLDVDGDNHAVAGATQQGCEPPNQNYTDYTYEDIPENDCDDSDASITTILWYQDTDQDGLGDPAVSQESCTAPTTNGPWVLNSDDQCPLIGDPTNSCIDEDPIDDPDTTCWNNGGTTTQVVITGNNYIYSRSYQTERDTPTAFFGQDDEGLIQNITYFDGLGRPTQQIGLEQSPADDLGAKKDIVTMMKYDGFGRMAQKWLPVPMATGAFGSAKTGVESSINGHYNAQKYESTTNPYSLKAFDNSPLNRIEKQAAPGNDWALGSGHEIEFDYQTNVADEVRFFEVTFNNGDTEQPQLTENGNYLADRLYKNVTYDENYVSGKNHSIEEFTDKQGRVLLKRTYADITNSDGSVSVAEPHDTYYVYDDYGNLTFVLPPKMEPRRQA